MLPEVANDDEHDPRVSTVRGLALPPLLLDLLSAGRWRHPGDAVLRTAMPWFQSPLIFLTSVAHMRRESESLDMFADDPQSSTLFREKRRIGIDPPIELPWLDVEQAFFIAVNRIPGDDVALALDYRGDPTDPPVVASDFWSDPHQCAWRPVSPALSIFADTLGLSGTRPISTFDYGSPQGPVVDWQTDTPAEDS